MKCCRTKHDSSGSSLSEVPSICCNYIHDQNETFHRTVEVLWKQKYQVQVQNTCLHMTTTPCCQVSKSTLIQIILSLPLREKNIVEGFNRCTSRKTRHAHVHSHSQLKLRGQDSPVVLGIVGVCKCQDRWFNYCPFILKKLTENRFTTNAREISHGRAVRTDRDLAQSPGRRRRKDRFARAKEKRTCMMQSSWQTAMAK